VAFVWGENLSRRHLTSGQKAAIAVELEDFKKVREEAKRRQIEAGKEGKDFGVLGGRGKKKPLEEIIPEGVLDDGNRTLPNRESHRSRSQIATTYGTNPRYIDRAAKLKESRPDLHQQVKTGELTIPKAIQQLKADDREERQQVRDAAIERATPPEPVADQGFDVAIGDVWALGNHRIYCGDSADWNPGKPAKMAFADPPYNGSVADWDKGFVWQHDWLTKSADYVFVTPGTANLQSFLSLTAMRYRWQYTYWVSNAVSRCNDWGISNVINPLLFSDLPSLRLERCRDFEKGAVVISETKDSSHPGRKPSGLLIWLMEMVTEPGDLVVDPFLGSGTTLFAAEAIGRVCHGCEINPDYCADILARWRSPRSIARVMLAAIGCDGPAIVHAAAVQWRSIMWRSAGEGGGDGGDRSCGDRLTDGDGDRVGWFLLANGDFCVAVAVNQWRFWLGGCC
jgi:DNA modification methylase